MTKHATITARLMLCFSSRIWFNLDFVLQIFWALGTVFEVLLAILVMPTLGWRWLLGLSTIPLFIFAILCFVSMMLSVLKGSTTCKQSKLQLYHDMFFLGGVVGAVATRECSIRCADREPRKGSGHIEAHCYRERSAHATGKTYRCQTGKSLFL